MLFARSAVLAVFAALAVAGCGVPRALGIAPYRIEIQQGNFVSAELVAQLKPGMSKDQVKALLGTPLINDIFHSERWDYLFWREPTAGKRETRRVALYFEEGKLARVDGNAVPTSAAGR
jgi:outer membrane protein assembly factor BamE